MITATCIKIIFGFMAIVSATGAANAEGVRAELHAGFDGLDRRGASSSEDGFAGIGIGYDFPITDRTFIGVEANLDESNISNRISTGQSDTTVRLKANRDINVNARVGTSVGSSGKTKIYALGGYTNLRVKLTGVFTPPAGPPIRISDSGNADGYRVGLGIQRDIGSRAYAKVEYRYSNYEGGFTRNQGLVGVGFRF
jgi:outer membrane immunogenic protein